MLAQHSRATPTRCRVATNDIQIDQAASACALEEMTHATHRSGIVIIKRMMKPLVQPTYHPGAGAILPATHKAKWYRQCCAVHAVRYVTPYGWEQRWEQCRNAGHADMTAA